MRKRKNLRFLVKPPLLESNGDALLATSHEKGSAFKWGLDSECTYHVCLHEDFFTTMILLILVLSLWAIMPNVSLLEFMLFRSRHTMALSGP